MKTNKLRRKPVSIANGRWLAYAAAGAASSLGGTHSAEAEIHYSGVIDATIGKGFGYIHINIPLDHSARLRFFVRGIYQLAFSISGAAVSNSICGYVNRFGSQYVSRLSQGVVISNCAFYPQTGTFLIYPPYSGGPFFARGIGFIGFRFNNGGGMQYGWLRVKMPGPPYSDTRFKLVDYAWGDPGDQIRAGQTSLAGDQVEAIPDQGSLGLLALGGAGLMVWRKRRRSSAASEVGLT
jgi:hypothetical protein